MSRTVHPLLIQDAVRLLNRISDIAGSRTLIDDARVNLAQKGVIPAVRRRDTPVIFDWLFDALSYQGVSDRIAYSYMEQHGRDTVGRYRRWIRRTGELSEAGRLLDV